MFKLNRSLSGFPNYHVLQSNWGDVAQIADTIAVVAMSALTSTFADTTNLADDFALMGAEDEVFKSSWLGVR